ncbi:hypothetical protein JCM16358_18770 [Halanaerocella petrolearia]
MKKIITFLIIFFLIISFLIGGGIKLALDHFSKDKAVKSEEAYSLPKITLQTITGGKVKFNKIQEPTILFFWLPESKGCQLQLKVLSKIRDQFNSKLRILAIGIGNLDQERIKKIADKKELEFPILIDTKTELTKKLKVTAIPTLIFYQPHKKPTIEAGLKDERELIKLINSHLVIKSK